MGVEPPPALPTLGLLGGGQLGRMTALAAVRLGLRVRILTPEAAGPEAAFADVTVADWTDPAVLRAFARGCDAITVESEWAPVDALAGVLPSGIALWPGPDTLRLVRHKGRQKAALAAAGLPLPGWTFAPTPEAAIAAADALGWPVVLKRFEGSYDGYGNATARTPDDVRATWPGLAGPDGLLVEAFVPFVQELAVLVARRANLGGQRGANAAHVVYPVVATEHREHQLHAAWMPAGLTPEAEARAQRVALAAVEAVGGVGLVAVELFLLADGGVLVNEIAPRPHNTGHLTIEACHTSQFENHVRAVLGWPLGEAGLRVPAACVVNVVGRRAGPAQAAGLADALAVPGAAVHLYGKTETRPRRKMGHVTATAASLAEARARAEEAAALLQL